MHTKSKVSGQCARVDEFGEVRHPRKSRRSSAGADQLSLMLRTLPAERFHLTFHHVQKDLKVYSLTQDKART
jgi:uncharacterized protein (TIGR03435 family)